MSFRSFSLGAATFLAMLAGPALQAAHAQGATVTLSGSVTAGDCTGGFATLNGNGNAITFRNACQTLTVNGNGNNVQIELQSGGLITLNGTGNAVSYAAVGGAQGAAVVDHGQGNTVTRLAALPGGAATITGNTAAPGGVSVQGANGESVQIGPNGIVAAPTPGTGGAVAITPRGVTVAPGVGTPPPAAAATGSGQLMLSGDRQNQDAACGGANVYISGDNGRFTLRGGCKALYIRGDHDIVHVELTPGGEIAVQGDNTTVYVLLMPPGSNPKLLVTGEDSRAFLVQHIDDTTGTEIPASVRSGALPMPPSNSVAATVVGAPVAVLTPQAALAFARSQSVVALQRDLGAVRTPQGTVVSLSGDVLFDFDMDRLRPDAQRSLAELAVLITRTQPRGLRIVGYTDSIGAPQYNLDLSDRRSRNVERWLLDYGRVQVAALHVEGRGANDPVAPNMLPDGRDNPAGRQQNRRVEILLEQ
jgi:outer membrane protein OmpA-like peptidoglycan-associated protein